MIIILTKETLTQDTNSGSPGDSRCRVHGHVTLLPALFWLDVNHEPGESEKEDSSDNLRSKRSGLLCYAMHFGYVHFPSTTQRRRLRATLSCTTHAPHHHINVTTIPTFTYLHRPYFICALCP
jgi:hypothetical protein